MADNQAYGSRLLPQVLDELAREMPSRIYATLPFSTDISHGFRDVTVVEMANAVNKCAWWLNEHISRTTTFETLAYMGVSDLRYPIVFLAAVKCGYKVLLPSVRNSAPMNMSLLEQTGCTKFIYAAELRSKLEELQQDQKDLKTFEVPSFDALVGGDHQHYPYHEEFEKVYQAPIVILHSSGSTGPPKPIVMTPGSFSVADNDRYLPQVEGRKTQNFALYNFECGGRFYSPFPAFHLAGFMSMMVVPIFSTTATLVLGPATKPPTGALLNEIMLKYELRGIFSPPSILEGLLQEPGSLDRAKKLDFIVYAGGPLGTAVGDQLSKVTSLCQFYGQSETGPVQALIPLPDDWAYIELHPMYAAEMQPSVDDAFELVLHRDPSLSGIRMLSHNYPDVEEWRTRDLFKPHPSKPNLWRFHGRADDIIVLSNGEKFNPVPIESLIQGHPLVKGALVVGRNRFQPALLIEPVGAKTAETEQSLIAQIWPTVQQANDLAPGHARIVRSKITVARSKEFPRAAKGTIVRTMAESTYASEIDRLYTEDATQASLPGLSLTNSASLEAVVELVRSVVSPHFTPVRISDTDDFYNHGLDSLRTLEIVSQLRANLQADYEASWLTARIVYASPTIGKLAATIFRHINSDATGNSGSASRVGMMENLVKKYVDGLPLSATKAPDGAGASSHAVLLTGSTGSFGVHLLQALLANKSISKIYCLDRSPDAKERHRSIYSTQRLMHDPDTPRVVFHRSNPAEPNFGLSPAIAVELFDSVDVVIHNAWKVDFNHHLESFESQLYGVSQLIKLTAESPRKPHVAFISSVAASGNWASVHGNSGPVPELPLDSFEVAENSGYGESKHVAERILCDGAERSGVPVSILRVGQIDGPVTGAASEWNSREWFPALVKTSKALGMVPDYLPDPDWIPVDVLSTIVVELLPGILRNESPSVYNLVNPKRCTWGSLIEPLKAVLGPTTRVVPLAEWLDILGKADTQNPDELTVKPALKILHFYHGLRAGQSGLGLKYDTKHTVSQSSSFASLPAVHPEWMDIWLAQWRI